MCWRLMEGSTVPIYAARPSKGAFCGVAHVDAGRHAGRHLPLSKARGTAEGCAVPLLTTSMYQKSRRLWTLSGLSSLQRLTAFGAM